MMDCSNATEARSSQYSFRRQCRRRQKSVLLACGFVLQFACSVSVALSGELLERSAVLRVMHAAHRSVPSRVQGTPDPPPEYRSQRVWPKLSVRKPVFAINEPGSSRILFLTEAPHRLCRTTENPGDGTFETLHEFSKGAVAYSIEFHPDFQRNGFVYVGWNGFPGRDAKPEGQKKHSIVTRFTLAQEKSEGIEPDSEVDVIAWESNGHNGAAMAFGPDGLMYVTSGDGTSDSDVNLAGQGLNHLLAKVLRIDVDHPDPGKQYSVPRDNPFVGQPDVRPETWAYGFRNPWRIAVDQENGQVWVGNNGQDLWEQVYLVEKGANYGWSVYEGGHIFYAERELGPHPVSKPLFDHPHSESRSLTGGIIYRGDRLPKLKGAYIYGDYSTGKIWAARMDGDKVEWHAEIADTDLAIAGFGTDADGELLIVDHRQTDGGFHTLTVNDQPFDPDQFPRKLSETGLFTSVAEHRMHPGAIPYDVIAPLWSDGAAKSRFLVMPPGEEAVKFNESASWEFPDGTVTVKSFAIQTDDGNPNSSKWIETRLMLRQQGEWAGYSYAWNNDQTEATLVAAGGADRTLRVRKPDGDLREQIWRYPSRTECMVCHSRAAKFVLGLSTLQLNKNVDYGDVTANQIDVLKEFELVSTSKQTSELKRLADPYDEDEPLETRARSYLHANCAQCHIQAGGGNAQFSVAFGKSLQATRLVDAAPLHHTYGIAGAKLIAPGDPERSVLLNRMERRGQGQMPQLGTNVSDRRAVDLIREWIKSIPSSAE